MTRARLITLLTGIMLLIAPAANAGRACTGQTPCTACKNCHGCRWCAKDGGTCGVCKKSTNYQADPLCSGAK